MKNSPLLPCSRSMNGGVKLSVRSDQGGFAVRGKRERKKAEVLKGGGHCKIGAPFSFPLFSTTRHASQPQSPPPVPKPPPPLTLLFTLHTFEGGRVRGVGRLCLLEVGGGEGGAGPFRKERRRGRGLEQVRHLPSVDTYKRQFSLMLYLWD